MRHAPSQRELALRFGVLLPLLGGGLLVLATQTALLFPARDALVRATAATAGGLLPLTGWDVEREGLVLRAPGGRGVVVARDCDALAPLLLFLAAVFVAPATWRARLSFGALGLGVLFLLNQARIGHLLWLSGGDLAAFRRAHEALWPAGMLVAAAGFFLLFAARTIRRG